MVAMLAPDMIIGDRPFVSDDRTREQREKDFRREAREADPEAWKAMSPADRNAEVKRIRDKWGDENIGTVPASTTYEEWMRRQAPEFQDATLGPSRAEMFRNGDATLDQFVDAGGRTRTLSELDTLVRPSRAPASLVQSIQNLPPHPTIAGAVVSPIPEASRAMLGPLLNIPFDTLVDARNGRTKLPTRMVDLSQVYTNQPEVGPDALLGIAQAEELEDIPPLFIEVNGSYIIGDGNHRTTVEFLRGVTSILARILKVP
jgi:hypothetical protein